MSGRACKAGIDCTGFLHEVQNTFILIANDKITDPKAIDAFNEMKTGFEERYERWKAKYIDFEDNP